MNKSDLFIDYYNKIDIFLSEEHPKTGYISFYQKVKSSKNTAVIRFKDELLSLANLRNAIVHNPKIGNKTIAEPHEKTVERLKEIHKNITKPKKVIPEFKFEVLGAKKEDYIKDILKIMKEQSFSQFPVFDDNNQVLELINNNTISRWLTDLIDDNGDILIEKVKVEDLIPEIEFKENYKYVSRNTSIYDAYDLFINQINTKKRNLDVVFITETGKNYEPLLGLITIADIANLV